MRGPSWGGVVAVVSSGATDGLVDVLAQVADGPLSPGCPGGQALDVVLFTEASHVRRSGLGVHGVEGLVPGGEQLAGGRVGVAAVGPDRSRSV